MSKKVYFDAEVLDIFDQGVDAVAEAVKPTLGPGGRNVAIEKAFGGAQITKDGVTVARESTFDDLRMIGAEIIKQASIRTAEVAGDGTTSSMVMSQALYHGLKKAITAGMHPIFLKRGVEEAARLAVRFIEEYAAPVADVEEITKVAALASNGDEELGKLIAQAIEMVGKDGVISVEESQSIETTLEFSEGLQFDRGYVTPDFLLDPEAVSISLDNAYILIADKRLSSAKELLPVLEKAQQESRPLFIVAHDIEGEALQLCLFNHLNRVVTIAACKAPRIGQKRTEMLQNLAALTGGTVVSDETGITTHNTDMENLLGGANTVTADKDVTTFIGGHGTDDAIEQQITNLRARLNEAWSEHDKEFYQQQMSQLSGGIALIRVGAPSEIALKEFKARVEDALSATQAAVRGGIVPGGGTTLIEASKHLEGLSVGFETPDETYGFQLLIETLKKPFMQIMSNAGIEPTEAFYLYQNKGGPGRVVNARTGQVEDAMEAGVIDPAMVVQQVVQNSVSVATTLATASCIVADSSLEKPE